jgi:hypothetical protein
MPNIGFIRDEVLSQLEKWGTIRDCVEGEIAVKKGKEKYLPKPQALGDPEEIATRYKSYLTRANFYWATGRTLEGLVGQVFSKDPNIDLPPEIAFLEENIDGAGNSIKQQSKRTLSDVVSLGRCGLLADFPTLEFGQVTTKADVQTGRIRPRVLFYSAERVINWRQTNQGGETYLTLLVLTEDKTESEDGFEITTKPRWRVFQCDGVQVQVTIWKENPKPKDPKDKYEIESGPFTLLDHKSFAMDRIPFTFIGSKNNDASVDASPMFGLAAINIAHYRNSADLEESSFIVGQSTPVFAGLTQDWVDENFKNGVHFGSRTAIPLPVGGSATLLQASPNPLPLELMRHKENQMRALGAKLIDESAVPETATGKVIEATSESSILSSAAKNVSEAYRKTIWFASRFLGEVDPEKIIFEFNTDFGFAGMDAQERAQLIAEWHGELITWEEARDSLRRAGIATIEDEEAKKQIEVEAAARGEFQENPQNLNA